jgi:hypothetical protein
MYTIRGSWILRLIAWKRIRLSRRRRTPSFTGRSLGNLSRLTECALAQNEQLLIAVRSRFVIVHDAGMGRKLMLFKTSERGGPAICRAAKLPALS